MFGTGGTDLRGEASVPIVPRALSVQDRTRTDAMNTRSMIGALIALAPVVAIAQIATTPPPVGNAMEGMMGESAPADPATTNPAKPAEPTMDTNAIDDAVIADPAADGAITAPDPTAPDPTAPKPKR